MALLPTLPMQQVGYGSGRDLRLPEEEAAEPEAVEDRRFLQEPSGGRGEGGRPVQEDQPRRHGHGQGHPALQVRLVLVHLGDASSRETLKNVMAAVDNEMDEEDAKEQVESTLQEYCVVCSVSSVWYTGQWTLLCSYMFSVL